MQEKSTKLFQQKLDALTELPDGFSFDAAHSWNRMEEKLTDKQTKQKRALWYIAAAASIALIISIVYLNQQATIKLVAVKPETIIKEQPGVVESKSSSVVLNTQPKEKKATSASIKKATKENTSINPAMNPPAKESELVVQINTPQKTKGETSLPETTVVVTPVSTTPVKQKIIHINELLQEHQLEQQRVAETKRNQKPAEEEINTEKNTEPSKPWYKKSKLNLTIKNQ